MLTLLTAAFAFAQSTASTPVDLGVLKNSEIRVVQKVLYTKEKRLEMGAHLGILPFDRFTWSPQLALTGGYHLSENVAVEAQLGGGYGFPNGFYNDLAGPEYGVAVEAYRYLASATVDAQWSPIYAKMNLGRAGILHHDVYLLAGAGATLEQSVFPSGDIAIAPTLPIGIGARVFVSPNAALRFELRDNLMIEKRVQSGTTDFKQNIALTVGYVRFGKKS